MRNWELTDSTLQIDLEEAKTQEIAKMQSALHEMEGQLGEANAAILREREAAKLAIEQAPPVIKEVPVVDNTKLELLKSHNEELEVELKDWKQKAEAFEKRYLEVQKQNEVSNKEAEESHSRLIQLQEMIERLETNLSNLESENQVLRQQALDASSNEELSEEMKLLETKIAKLESENQLIRSQSAVVVQHVVTHEQLKPPGSSVVAQQVENGHQVKPEIQSRLHDASSPPVPLVKQKSLTDRQLENHDALIKCLAEDKRFDKNRPAAACIVFKSLVQWRSFEADKTTIFDRIIHTIKTSIENQDNIRDLAYWLSTTSTLLFLLQNTLKASNASGVATHRSRAPVTLFGRMAQGYRSSASGIGISTGYSGMVGKRDVQSKIEAKYPALLFKQHLTAYVEKIYGMIRDTLKKEISPFLHVCIQAPRSVRARSIRGSSRSVHSSLVAKQASAVHWQSIVDSLDRTLSILCENYVPSMIIRKTFSQVFLYIDVQLFNSLLLRRECCSFSNGEYVKLGLQELERWCSKATNQFAGNSWDELKHIRPAVGFLVLHQKTQKSLEEIIDELCPVLSIPQIYRIGTMFWDDKYGTQGLSPEVIAKMRTLMMGDSIDTPNNSFLLDDDSSIPFSLDDISRSGLEINVDEVEPPPLLRQKSDFHFLLQRAD